MVKQFALSMLRQLWTQGEKLALGLPDVFRFLLLALVVVCMVPASIGLLALAVISMGTYAVARFLYCVAMGNWREGFARYVLGRTMLPPRPLHQARVEPVVPPGPPIPPEAPPPPAPTSSARHARLGRGHNQFAPARARQFDEEQNEHAGMALLVVPAVLLMGILGMYFLYSTRSSHTSMGTSPPQRLLLNSQITGPFQEERIRADRPLESVQVQVPQGHRVGGVSVQQPEAPSPAPAVAQPTGILPIKVSEKENCLTWDADFPLESRLCYDRAEAKLDLLAKVQTHVLAAIQREYGMEDLGNWRPSLAWIDNLATNRQEKTVNASGEIFYRMTLSQVHLPKEKLREARNSYYHHVQQQRSVLLGKWYFGVILVVGGLGILLRLGTGRRPDTAAPPTPL